jgi:hypothetical protein
MSWNLFLIFTLIIIFILSVVFIYLTFGSTVEKFSDDNPINADAYVSAWMKSLS